jgi:biotin carboxyl carrier protein
MPAKPLSRPRGDVALIAALALAASLLAGCSGRVSEAGAAAPPAPRQPGATPEIPVVRASGVVQAVRSFSIRVPQLSQITGQGGRQTVTALIKNGAPVKTGDPLVEFDRTAMLDQEIEAKAKLGELGHQLEERQAQIRSDSAKRVAQLREAEAELNRANLQLKKGPILSEIDRLKNEAKATSATAQVASLKRSSALREKAEQAALQILTLKRQRQQVMLERIQSNLQKLVILAPQDGMVAIESIWRQGSRGPVQEGDQVWPGLPLLRIFDPSEMYVETLLSEADYRHLGNAARASVYLDAYPSAKFESEMDTSSLVATSGLESPVRSFLVRFRIVGQDNRLLPDLSASIEIHTTRAAAQTARRQTAAPQP